MFKRVIWTGVGYGLGIGSSVLVQRKVKRTVNRYAPPEVRQQVADRAKAAGSTVSAAAREGRLTMRAEERALRHEFGLRHRRSVGRRR